MRLETLLLPCLLPALAAAADPASPAAGLDLAGITLTKLYEADFAAPLRLVKEDSLFDQGRRARDPGGAEWVLEGAASAELKDGRLHLVNEGSHLVCWNTRRFPGDFLLEFGVIPQDPNEGLNIVFFCARGRKGGGLFDPDQPRRGGEFKTYHSGVLDCYHASYWATRRDGTPRGTAHIRKNHGFHLVADGPDLLAGTGPGPHRVRVLKIGGDIAVEVNGSVSVRWNDDGRTLGPVLNGGLIGLRQMSHTRPCAYTHFKVWSASRRS